MPRAISPESLTPSRWAGGTTLELLIWPPGAAYSSRRFDWRLSTATVELEVSDFSPLPGFGRWITVLEGGFELRHDGGPPVTVRGTAVHGFSGGSSTSCRGTATDFNLIYRDGLNCRMERLELRRGRQTTLAPDGRMRALFPVAGRVVMVGRNGSAEDSPTHGGPLQSGPLQSGPLLSGTLYVGEPDEQDVVWTLEAEEDSDLLVLWLEVGSGGELESR